MEKYPNQGYQPKDIAGMTLELQMLLLGDEPPSVGAKTFSSYDEYLTWLDSTHGR